MASLGVKDQHATPEPHSPPMKSTMPSRSQGRPFQHQHFLSLFSPPVAHQKLIPSMCSICLPWPSARLRLAGVGVSPSLKEPVGYDCRLTLATYPGPHCQLCFTVVFAYFLCAVEAFSLQSSTSHFPASEPPWTWDIFDDKFFPFPPFFDSSVSSTPHTASSPCQRHFLDMYRRHRHRQGTRRCHPSSMPGPYSSRSSSWKCRPCPPHLKANHQHLELCLNHQYLRIGRSRQHLSHS